MTTTQQIITIAVVVLGTMTTRFLPFIIFSADSAPEFVRFLGRVLPNAVIGLLVIYSLKDSIGGLTQIIAFHYGTIPIVRETGGLKDTVIPLNEFEDTGDGFSFSNYNGDELINTVNYSKYIYFEQPEIWDHMITRAMEKNLSWGVSKRRYEELYNTLIGR